MFTSEKKLVMATSWCFALLGGWALLLPLARAEDKQPQDKQPQRQIRVEVRTEGCIPVLSKVPYINKLFTNLVPDQEIECGNDGDADASRKFAIEWQACPAGFICPLGKIGECRVICMTHPDGACQACNQSAQACNKSAQNAVTCAACSSGQCPACASDDEKCVANCDKLSWAELGKRCCAEQSKISCAKHGCDHLIQRADFEVAACEECEDVSDEYRDAILQLTVQNANLESKLDAQNQIYKARVEILEQWARLVAEKSKLEAEVAFTRKLSEERQDAWRQTLELKAEKTELESLVRAAHESKLLEAQHRELMAENERLKQRVSELERHISVRPGEVNR